MDEIPQVSLDDLVWVLTQAARSPGHKVLYCAADVTEAIGRKLPAASPPSVLPFGSLHDAGVLAGLLAVNIITTPDSPPGSFRLVHHYDLVTRKTTCEVRGETVSHDRCPVVYEGILSGEVR